MSWQEQMKRQIGILILGQLICGAVTVSVFALIGKFDLKVIWGSLAGIALASANHFLLSLFANLAADKAENQDVAGGQKLIQMSYMGRLIGIFSILILCAKSGWFNLIALVVPLALTRPVLYAAELLQRKVGN